jgi:Tle cognate immunity protein 4 C-terminal domain/Tle cognate immunity protein 4 N-terminal domain
MKTNRQIAWLGVAAAIALSAWLWLRDATSSTKDIQKMSTYTEQMTTHCVGRFLIDVPQKATTSEGAYGLRIASLKTKKAVALPQATLLSQLDAEIAQRKEFLSAVPSPLKKNSSNQTKFQAAYQPSGNTRSLWYTKEDGNTVMDGYVAVNSRVFELHTNANDENDVKEFNDFLVEIAPTLRVRENSEIPSTPGACFNGGFTSMNPERGENVSWTWELDGHPDVSFGVSMRTNGAKVRPGVVDREAEILKDLGQYIGGLRILRKQRLVVGEMNAQEWSHIQTGDKTEYNFQIDIPGLPNNNAAPFIKLSLTVGGYGPNGYAPPSLTEGEALALWDAVTKTLRLRPGAV